MSVPNQKVITIHKPKYYQGFLQIGIDQWQAAYRDLNKGDFGLYLCLCGNMDGYRLELSPAAICPRLGYSDSTYRRAVEHLKEKGYLIHPKEGGGWHFYTTPQPTDYVKKPKAAPVACDSADEEMHCDEWAEQNPCYDDFYEEDWRQ